MPITPVVTQIIASMNCDGNVVMRELMALQRKNPSIRLFQKHMAHHLVELDLGFLQKTSNVFLIRDPHDMLPSLTVQIPDAGLADTGLQTQCEIYDDLHSLGQSPAVLDARELLLDPGGVLLPCAHTLAALRCLACCIGPRGRDRRRRYLGAALVRCRASKHGIRSPTGPSTASRED